MTAIKGYVAPSRRQGVLGVHSMDNFNMKVPNLARAAAFYSAFGLDVREEGETLGLYSFGNSHRWVTLSEGLQKQLNFLSFGVFEDDFEPIRAHVETLGVLLVDPPPGFERNGFWFRDNDGLLIEVRVAEKTSPNEKSPTRNVSVGANLRGAPLRSQVEPVRPRRLAHMLIFTRDVDRAIRFYSTVLGLRLSDRSGDGIAFMHGVHGSDHHMIAFARSDGPGLHHCSWDLGSVDEIGLGAMQMADKGFSEGWGLGRHVLGSNYFHYVRDPWGSYAEYSSDIDYVSADHDWAADDHGAEDAFYIWGPTPPADFAENYEMRSSR